MLDMKYKNMHHFCVFEMPCDAYCVSETAYVKGLQLICAPNILVNCNETTR